MTIMIDVPRPPGRDPAPTQQQLLISDQEQFVISTDINAPSLVIHVDESSATGVGTSDTMRSVASLLSICRYLCIRL